ncbi:hypothetical protein SRABI27_03238 [Pedobacter sp. Bi27]|nr:hypothetical protein SRABI36_00699 [Pedobacter sp. Bi36]CAH0261603.1 hypothetical protein SRABI27_03238 [Pedobacter sp. Bi27]
MRSKKPLKIGAEITIGYNGKFVVLNLVKKAQDWKGSIKDRHLD